MAITITAKLDASGVKSGAQQVENAVEGMGDAAASASERMANELLDSRNAIQNLEDEIEDLRAELGHMAAAAEESFDDVVRSANRADDAVDSVGSGGKSLQAITAIGTGYLALVDIAGKFVEAGKKAVEVVQHLAEQGNPAAKELSDSFAKVGKSLLSVAEDPIFQEWMGEIAEQINDTLVPAIKSIPDALVSIGDAFEDASLRRADTFFGDLVKNAEMVTPGLLVLNKTLDAVFGAGPTDEEIQKQREYRDELREQSKALVERQKEVQESKDRVQKAEEELAKLEEGRRNEREDAALEMIDNEEELVDIITRETEAIRERAKAGTISDKERADGIRTIEAAENRLKNLRKSNADEEKKAAEESKASAEKLAGEKQRLLNEEVEAKQKAEREKVDAERRSIEERKRLVMGGDVKGAEQLLGSQTREQVKEAYAQRQAEEAASAFDASGASAKEVAVGRKRALAQARRQFDNGTADSSDVRDAQVELAGKAADSAVAQGKSSKETAQATKEAIAELAKTQNELEQVQAEMANMRSLMGGISRQGERRRAQVAGSRQ
jgi:hypothetical protein